MFRKTTYFIDSTTGPAIKTRFQFDRSFLKKATIILAVLLVAAIFLMIASSGYTEPTIRVSCTNADILVFQDMEDNYIAYASLANAEQLEAIKSLQGIVVDQSVDNFTLCSTEVHHFELRLDGEKVFCHGDDVNPPPEYNHEISSEELAEMLQNSSEETQFLYKELSRIFKTA